MLEWAQVGYTDDITELYVSDDEYQGTFEDLEEDIKLARRLVSVHRVTADRMLMRAQRLESERNVMKVDEKFQTQHDRLNVQLKATDKLRGTKHRYIGDLDPNEPKRQQVKGEPVDESPE